MAVNDPWAVGVAVDEVDPWAVGAVVGETTWSPMESQSTQSAGGSVSLDTPPAGSIPPGPPVVSSEAPAPDVPLPDSPEGRYLRGQYEAYRQYYQDSPQQYLPVRAAMAPVYDIGATLKAFYYDAILGDSDAANKVLLSRAAQSAALGEYDAESYVGETIAGGLTGAAGSLGSMGYGAAVGTLAGNPLGGAVAMAAYNSGASSRAQALAEGATEREANITGLANAAIEAGVTLAFSAAGKGGLESLTASRLSRASLLQAAKQVGPELAEENIISQLQLAVDGVVRDEWATPGEMYKAAKDTTVQTLLAMGIVHEAGRAKVLAFLDNPSRKNAKEIGLGDATTKAEREAHVLGIKAQTIRQQLHALVGRNLQTTEEAEFLFGMLQSRADSAGVSLDKYVEDAGLEIRTANWEEWSAANKDSKGVMEMLAEPAFENLPQDAKERLSGTAIADDTGKPIPVYHGTQNPDFAGPSRENNRRVAAAPKLIADWKDATAKWRSETKIDEIKQDYLDLRSVLRILGMESASERNKNYDLVKRVATRHGYADWWAMWQDHMSLNKKLREMEAQVKQIEATAPTVPAWAHDAAKSGVLLDESEDLDPNLFGANDEGWWAAGAYFTDSPKEASEYAGGGGVFFGFLAAKRPYNRDSKISDVERAVEEEYSKRTRDRQVPDPGWYARQRSEARRDVLQSLGYDGEVGTVDTRFGPVKNYVVFKKDQIVHAKRGKGASSPETLAEPAFENLPKPPRQVLSETKVVDESGKPIPVYHRTPADFGAFDVSKAESGDYVGVYFAADPSAPTVNPDMGEGTRTIPAYLNLKNPATNADKKRAIQKLGPDWTPQQLTDALKAEGFDGVIDTDYRVTEYVAFDPQQVVNALTGEVMADDTLAESAPQDIFEPKAFDVEGYKSRSKIVDMPIDTFLKLAAKLTDGARSTQAEDALSAGIRWNTIPSLTIRTKAGESAVMTHEGRNRAEALKRRGYTTMPVELRDSSIRWSEQGDPKNFDYVEAWPTRLVSEDGSSGIAFPVRREDATGRYVDRGALGEKQPGKKKKANRAQIQFLRSEGRTVITAFEQADLASMVHELGHLFRRDLAGADLNAAARWAGVKKGRWTKGAEEQFADGFLKWVSDGKGPSPAVTRFFEQFAAYIRGLFDAHRKSRLDPLNISPEMHGVFGRLFGDTSLLRQEAAQQAVTPAPPVAPDAPEATFEINNQIPPGAPSGPPNAIQPPEAVPGPPQPPDAPTSPVDDTARNLALHAVDEATRDLKAFVDEQMGDPGRKTWDDAKLAAGQRLAQDPVGRRAYWQARVDAANSTGTPLSLIDMVDTVEVNLIANAYADEGFRTGNAEAIVQHNAFHTAFRNARTEQARSLGYRDPVAGPAERRKRDIQKALATDTPEIAALRKKGKSPDILAEVSDAVVRRYQDLTEKLASIGVDLKDLDGIAADPQKALAVLNAARPVEASWMDMLYEYWRNSILSGPVTHGVNTASNLLFVFENLAERTLEAGINTTLGKTKKTSATLGEIPLILRESLNKENWGRAIANALTAWRNEMPALEESLGREGRVRFDRGSYAIAGDPTKLSGRVLNKAGRLIRMMGFRPLLFMDEIAKTMTSHMEAAAMAYRLAKVESQSNSALDVQARTLELLNDRNSDAWTMALDKAQTLAFQGERGLVAGVTSKSIDAIRSMPGGRWIVPFRDTPAAVFEEGIRRMPVIGFLLDFAEQRRAGKSIAEIDFAPTLARQAIAMGVLTAIEAWLGDDDEPLITGTRDMVDRNQKDVAYRAFQPMTVRVPGTDVRVSYARLEPIATALAWSVDVVRAYKQGAKQGGAPQALASAAGESVTGMVRQVTTKTFMDTVGDLMEAVQSSARGEAHQFAEWSAKQAASLVPNFYRSLLRGNDIPQTRVWGKGDAYASMLFKRTAQQALGSPLGFPPTKRYDVWGRQITYSSVDAGAWNALKWVGVKTQTPSSVLDIDRALYVWNVRHPQQATHWSEPNKSFRVGKDHHYLTDEEYEEYSRRAGEYALANASRVKINLDNPTEQQIEAIGKAVTRGRTRARNELKRVWLERIRNEQPPTPAR